MGLARRRKALGLPAPYAYRLCSPAISPANRHRRLIARALALGTEGQILGCQVVLALRRGDGLAAIAENVEWTDAVTNSSL